MKIAISVPEDVFKSVEMLAKESRTSRSRVFVEAVREYYKKWKSREILKKLNEVWAVPLAPEEKAALSHARRLYWKTVKKEDFED